MPAATAQFFTGWMPFLPPNQQRQRTEGNTRDHNASRDYNNSNNNEHIINGMGLFTNPLSVCHPAMTVRALKRTQNTDPNQIIFSSFTNGLIIEGAL